MPLSLLAYPPNTDNQYTYKPQLCETHVQCHLGGDWATVCAIRYSLPLLSFLQLHLRSLHLLPSIYFFHYSGVQPLEALGCTLLQRSHMRIVLGPPFFDVFGVDGRVMSCPRARRKLVVARVWIVL
jgi:hypothetical protein